MNLNSSKSNLVKVLLILIVVCISIGKSAQAFGFGNPELSTEESSQIIKLLDTFSNGCTLTRGPSADAISVVRGLSSTIKASLDNPDCKSLAGVATSLDSATIQAQSLIPQANDSYVTDLEQQINSLEKQKQEITTLLTQTTDLSEIAALRSQLYAVRIELAGTLSNAHDSAINDKQIRRSQAVRLLLSSTNQAVNQILANESCWVGQPGVLQQVAGVGTTLSANAALMTPASQTAVLLTSGMSILSTIVNFFERLSVAKKVAQFDLALGSTALTCALEKMNDVYCSAQDTLNAIKKVGPKLHDPNEDPVWAGLGLLEKEIPTLVGWLQKIKSGGGANTAEDAEKKAEIELKDVKLNNSKVLFEGYFRDTQLRYNNTVDPEQKFSLLRSLILNITYRVCYTSTGGQDTLNTLCRVKATEFLPFFLLGLESNEYQTLIKLYNNLSFGSLDLSLLASAGIDKEFSLERTNIKFNNLYLLAKETLEIEKRLALGQDLTLIFDEAMKRNYKVANPVTAQSSLEGLIGFLSAAQKRQQPDPQKGLREQTLFSLTVVLNQILFVAQQEITPEQAQEEIFKAANLKIGTSFLSDRLERLIRLDLEQLVYNSDQIDDATRLPLLAASDAVKELRRYYQVSSLQEMQESASNAQIVMNKTLDPFVRLFANPMQRAFDEFDTIARKVGGDGAAQALALKTKMCFYFLGTMRPQDFFLRECEGLMAKSVLGLETPAFRKDLFKQPMEDRACLYRNFIMKNRIKERQNHVSRFPQFHKILQLLNSKNI
jgi:hypothetical protein